MSKKTKTSVLGGGDKIKFKQVLQEGSVGGFDIVLAEDGPEDWDNVTLLIKGEEAGTDIMYACDKSQRNDGVIYIGDWNDGVV